MRAEVFLLVHLVVGIHFVIERTSQNESMALHTRSAQKFVLQEIAGQDNDGI